MTEGQTERASSAETPSALEQNEQTIQQFSQEALRLALQLFEHFYFGGHLDSDEKAFSIAQQILRRFQPADDDTPLLQTPLGQKLTQQPLKVFFSNQRTEENDLPPRECDPGKFISLYDPNSDLRVTINIFGPVRRFVEEDLRDNASVFQRSTIHSGRTDKVLSQPAVLRVKVRFGPSSNESFVLRFRAGNNRLLCDVITFGDKGSYPSASLSRFTKEGKPDFYTNMFYSQLVTLASRARDLPFIASTSLRQEFAP